MDYNELARRMGVTCTGSSSQNDTKRMRLKDGGPATTKVDRAAVGTAKRSRLGENGAGILSEEARKYHEERHKGRQHASWGGDIKNFFNKTKDKAQEVGNKIKSGAEDAAGKIKSTAEDVGRKAKSTAEDVGNKVKTGAEGAYQKTRDTVGFAAGGKIPRRSAKAERFAEGFKKARENMSPRKDYSAENKKVFDAGGVSHMYTGGRANAGMNLQQAKAVGDAINKSGGKPGRQKVYTGGRTSADWHAAEDRMKKKMRDVPKQPRKDFSAENKKVMDAGGVSHGPNVRKLSGGGCAYGMANSKGKRLFAEGGDVPMTDKFSKRKPTKSVKKGEMLSKPTKSVAKGSMSTKFTKTF
jgi:hypothetical protein